MHPEWTPLGVLLCNCMKWPPFWQRCCLSPKGFKAPQQSLQGNLKYLRSFIWLNSKRKILPMKLSRLKSIAIPRNTNFVPAPFSCMYFGRKAGLCILISATGLPQFVIGHWPSLVSSSSQLISPVSGHRSKLVLIGQRTPTLPVQWVRRHFAQHALWSQSAGPLIFSPLNHLSHSLFSDFFLQNSRMYF